MPPQAFKVIANTEPIPYDAYVVNKYLDDEKIAKIRDTLLALRFKSTLAKRMLGRSKESPIRGFTVAQDNDYDSVRAVADYLDKPPLATPAKKRKTK